MAEGHRATLIGEAAAGAEIRAAVADQGAMAEGHRATLIGEAAAGALL